MSDKNGETLRRDQFSDDPKGQWKLWNEELTKAREEKREWRESGKTIDDAFLGRGSGTSRKLNLFTSNTLTTMALLYGKTPSVDVTRRHGDTNDPIGRCAASMLQRILNTDIQRDSDTFKTACKLALKDRLLPGLGNVRAFYTVQFGKPEKVEPQYKTDEATGLPALDDAGEPVVLAEGYENPPKKIYEEADIDHAHWEDQLWNAGARTFAEVTWWAFKADMTFEQLEERFGKEKAKSISLKGTAKRSDTGSERLKADPWARAEVWEIWDKRRKKVIWWSEGSEETLDEQDDTLGLEGFWPFPMPLFANTSNSALIPRPDYVIAQDQYIKVNELEERIDLLQQAIRVAGVYNGASPDVAKLLSEPKQNKLYPVSNWGMHAEKGGLKDQIDWLPLEAIVAALDKLRELRAEEINLLYQVTGLSDIMRGQGSGTATATEQAIKAKFAGVRTQDFQDEFARFVSDAQWIRAQIICKHFDDEEILKRSNVMATEDAQYAQQALQLLRSDLMKFRVVVKPESVSMADYATLKQERVEIMQGLSQLLSAFMPIGQAMPPMLPVMMKMIKWMFAGFRGGGEMEAYLDQAIQQVEGMLKAQANQPPQQDPAVEAEKVKLSVVKEKAKSDLEVNKAKTQSHMIKAQTDMRKAEHDAQMDQRQMMRDMQRDALGLNDPGQQNGEPGGDEREVR